MNDLQAIVSALGGKREGHKWKCHCPAHDDEHPSLSVSESSDGKLLVKCWAGCSQDAVIRALRERGLWPSEDRVYPKGKPMNKPVAKPARIFPSIESCEEELGRTHGGTWYYRHLDGNVAFAIVRIDEPQGRKRFLPLHPCNGQWQIGDPAGLLPLYNLPKLADAQLVLVLEGEKCADLASECHYVATTSAHGALSPHKSDWSPLAGKDVVIIPDNDAAGRAYAKKVANTLCNLNPPARVKIVELPGLAEGEDFEQFRCPNTQSEVVSKLNPLIEAAKPFIPDPFGSKGSSFPVEYPKNWPAPQPLPELLPAVQTFDPALLPESLRAWIEDIAERVQCPIDYPAVGAMIALASVVGRKVGIRPKRQDDWLVVANLWGAIVGRPGIMKSPALAEVLKPLKRLEIEAKEEFERAIRDFASKQMVAEVKRKEGTKAISKALKAGGDADAVAAELIDDESKLPHRKRYLTNDCTVEKLGVLLNENTNGITVFRDELIGQLKSLDRDGQEGARAFFLEGWNGVGRFTYDRIGRGTLDIEACCISVIGGIQPGPLSSYLRGAVEGGKADDGLLQRFQLIVWPEVAKEWRNVDRWTDTTARDRAHSVFRKLDVLDVESLGVARDGFDIEGIPYLRFAPDAQVEFDQWRAVLEAKLRSGEEHPAMEAHLAKYRSLVPSLALLIHLAEERTGSVTLAALQRAVGWAAYLETHARRLYSMVSRSDVAAARKLADKLRSGDLKDGFSLKDVYRPGWSSLSSREDAQAATRLLIDHDWLAPTKEFTDGAPRTQYWMNPKILET